MMKHNYTEIHGWFNMEDQYSELLDLVTEGGIFVELGVWRGRSTSYIVTEIVNKGNDVKFFAVDAFKGAVKSPDPYEITSYQNSGDVMEDFLKNTSHLKDHFNLIVNESDLAAGSFEDESVDVIFLDAGHSYKAVKDDIKAWLPKMKNGSMMSGHDFNWEGVRNAVLESLGTVDKVENVCWFKKISK
jgi:hypothetical protein